MTKINFTKAAVEALPTPKEGRAVYHDTRERGLVMKIEPSGHKSYAWYRCVHGKPIWRVIGECSSLSIEQARAAAGANNQLAAKWKVDKYTGANPFEPTREGITLKECFEDYLEGQLRVYSKNVDRAVTDAKWRFEKHVPKEIQNSPMAQIKRTQVRELHKKIGAENGKIIANRVIQLLRAVYNYGLKETEAYQGDNPAAVVQKFQEKSRTRFLGADELPKFFAAINESDNRDLRDLVILALMTGARRGDLLAMRWADVKLDAKEWNIPNPKNEIAYTIPLVNKAVETLKARRAICAVGSEYVFAGDNSSGHIVAISKAWQKFRATAGFSDLTIHDLRRSLGSHAVNAGVSLFLISRMLGHSSKSSGVTATYARIVDSTLRDAFKTATDAVLKAAAKKPRVEVIRAAQSEWKTA